VVKRGAASLALALALSSCGAPNLTFDDETIGAGGTSGGPSTGSAGSPGDASTTGSGGAAQDAPWRDRIEPDAGDGAVSCANQTVDGDESDVDCGGTACPRCAIGAACRQDRDCIGAYCKEGVCAQGSCIDKVKNLKETDVDCGGGDCPPCAIGASCISYTDCVQQSCIAGKCQSLACDDRFQGPGETDVDCGGPSCAPCVTGKRCLVSRDCSSGLCASQTCSAPSCSDGVANGTETDKDCGGGCAPCADGLACVGPDDCLSGVCSGRVCQAPTCSDKVKNQGETDVDCGGLCPRCRAGAFCGRDSDCLSANCAGTCQPCPKDMVAVPTPTGSSYCVDATEATVDAYSAFLSSSPPLSLMPSSCATKTSYAPSVPLDLSRPSYPVANVDWCDAYAFCAQLGKHLCGRIGGGAPLAPIEQSDASKSAWHNACSNGGTRTYPYGSSYSQGTCIDKQGVNAVRPVGSAVGCVGGFPGLHDMSGNVQEWEDNCSTMAGQQPSLSDNCRVRGGGFNDTQLAVTCASGSTRKRNQGDSATGFRCCF
jgi:hypothetical protein